MNKWFQVGAAGEKFAEEQEQKRKQASMSDEAAIKNWRFKLGYSQTGYVVFIDDPEFYFNEHQYQANGSYYNYDTCIKDIEGECPLCEAQVKYSTLAVCTIIDFTEYKKKDGTMSKPRKKILALKTGGREKLLRKKAKLGTLALKKFEIFRGKDQKSEATGTEFEYEKDVDIETLKKFAPEGMDANEWIKPYDYATLFAPKSASELRQAMGIAAPVGSAESEPFDTTEPAKKSLKDLI